MRLRKYGTALLGAVALASAQAGGAERGAVLYEMYCTQCHGLAGDGAGINVADMSVLPRDHTDPGEMSARTDEELADAIANGGKAVNKSVLMPAWGNNLDEEQIDALVAYLRELCCRNQEGR